MLRTAQSSSIKKNILLLSLGIAVTMTSGCSLFRSKKSADGAADSQIKSETTANGGSEKLDGSPINLGVTGSDSGTIEGLRTVFFDYDKAALAPEEKTKLMNNIEWMKKNTNAKLTIEGHCDQRGSAEYNLALGERRANAVRQILTASGIKAARLTTVSFGKEKLLSQGETEEAMAKNRRANFVPVQ